MKMEYDQMMEFLGGQVKDLQFFIQQATEKGNLGPAKVAEQRRNATELAIYCLREYIESWSCPMCGYQTKIPHDHKDKRACPKCLNKHMLPYAYLEQERMTKQMALLLQCASYYKKQPNGQIAVEMLNKLAEAGRFKPNEKSSLQSHK